MRRILFLSSLVTYQWNAFAAGPMPFSFMVTDNYCMAELAIKAENDIGLAVSDPVPFSDRLDGTYTCFGQDADVRPSAPIEIAALLEPAYGACELPTSPGYPKMNYFYWKAKALPDGRFQVFCGVDPSLVKKAPYFALGADSADQLESKP